MKGEDGRRRATDENARNTFLWGCCISSHIITFVRHNSFIYCLKVHWSHTGPQLITKTITRLVSTHGRGHRSPKVESTFKCAHTCRSEWPLVHTGRSERPVHTGRSKRPTIFKLFLKIVRNALKKVHNHKSQRIGTNSS